MNYEGIFSEAVAAVRSENRYRVFANLQRMAGEFPYARNHGAGPARVTVHGRRLALCGSAPRIRMRPATRAGSSVMLVICVG
jgi:hypothetical protein